MAETAKSQPKRPSHPLDAVPEIAPGAEARPDSKGCLQVRRQVIAAHPIERALRKWFAQPIWRRVNLDERGTYFWGQIDGKTRLRELAKRVTKRFELTEKIGVESTLIYTKELMLRQLIFLKIEGVNVKVNS